MEWITDAVRAAAILGVLTAAVTLPATDTAVLSMTLPAVMLTRMLGLSAGLDLAICLTVIVAAGSNVVDLYRAWAGWDLVVHAVCTGVLAAVALVILDDAAVIAPTGRRRTPMSSRRSPGSRSAPSGRWSSGSAIASSRMPSSSPTTTRSAT